MSHGTIASGDTTYDKETTEMTQALDSATSGPGQRVSRILPPSLRPLAMPLITGLVTGLIASMLIIGYSLTRPEVYTARVALSGVPSPAATSTADKTVPDFAAVLSNNMASVTEYVRTQGVLEDVTRAVPNSPSPEDVEKSITVELIPLSSLARISVSAPSPDTASALAQAMARNVIRADLIGPTAEFRLLESATPAATLTAPDRKLGLGLGLVGGAVLGVAAAAIHLLLRPRLVSRRQVARLLDDPTIAILEIDSDNALTPLRTFVSSIEGVQVMPVGPGAAGAVSAVREQLGDKNVTDRVSAPVLLVARRGKARPSDLTSAVALTERAGLRALGVALY